MSWETVLTTAYQPAHGLVITVEGQGRNLEPALLRVVRMPFTGEIKSVSLVGSHAGNAVVDIRKCSFSELLPGSNKSICGSSKPTLNNAQKMEDTALTGWTKTFNLGDYLVFSLESTDGLLWLSLTLELKAA